MTRSGDTGDIEYEHLSMIGDHMSISIPRHENKFDVKAYIYLFHVK